MDDYLTYTEDELADLYNKAKPQWFSGGHWLKIKMHQEDWYNLLEQAEFACVYKRMLENKE